MCECGIKICGNSPKSVRANLKIHKKSILHQRQMSNAPQIKKERDEEKPLWSIEVFSNKLEKSDVERAKEINKEMEKMFNKKEGVSKE